MVPHHLLLNKLTLIGINEYIINWVAEYLFWREQSVVLNGRKSSRVLHRGCLREVYWDPCYVLYLLTIFVRVYSQISSYLRMIAYYTELYKITQTSA